MRMSVREAAEFAGVENVYDDTLLLGVKTDSRACKTGDLFICVKGSRVDGHDFARQAQDLGASAILAEKPLPGLSIPVLVSDDSIAALDNMALGWRKKFKGKVIALTGTAGKTTLKDTLATILQRKGKTRATEKNYNNQLGVALTILGADGDEQFWIVEAGISHANDMDELGRIIQPDLAIILNASEGHTEGLGEKGVAWHKARLCHWLSETGQALVNTDYPGLLREAAKYRKMLRTFSLNPQSGANYFLETETKPGFYELNCQGEKSAFQTPFEGEWGAEIALAATGAAKTLQVPEETIQNGFNSCAMPQGRMNLRMCGNLEILDDTYNANPLSMRRMLESAAKRAKSRNAPWFAILGEMGELGSVSRECHRDLGRTIGGLEPAMLIWKGDFSSDVKQGLIESGAEKTAFLEVNSVENFEDTLNSIQEKKVFPPNSVILFKGSRMNRLENFVQKFIGKFS